jgi:hypothetical protein
MLLLLKGAGSGAKGIGKEKVILLKEKVEK